MSQWSTKALGKNGPAPDVATPPEDPFVVVLMQGKNTFGDRIYSYLKTTMPDLSRMHAAILAGAPFNPSDFGSVVAAGKGDPPEDVKAEISSMYRVLDSSRNAAAPATPPPEQKAWDEY